MRQSLVIIPAMHILTYLAIGLDLPILRQIIVFTYLTFVPGFILLKFLKLKETKVVDTILFSVGLSLAFLMFVGFFINELFLAVGISRPLSTIPLIITLSILTLSLFFVGYRRDIFEGFSSWRGNLADSKEVILKSAILFLPALLGIIGAVYVSFPSISTPILSFMIIMIAALFAVGGISLKLIPSKFYPLMLFAISIALAFHVLFISKYMIGYDGQLEYQIFTLTTNRGYWTLLPTTPLRFEAVTALNYNSMLSVTVLPSIYSALLNIEGEVLFKTLYPFVFSLVPVVLYRIYEQQMGKTPSLLSTLFLISSPLAFYGVGLLSLNRQIVAMFFLVLSILILLDKTMALGKRTILFVVFGAALIVSHYSTAYLYLGLLFLTYIISRVRDKRSRVLNLPILFLLSIMSLAWYGYTSSPLTSVYNFLNLVVSRFTQDIASPTALPPTVFATQISVPTLASAFNWVLFLTVHSLIFVGILFVLFKGEKAKLEPTYRYLLILSFVVLVSSLVLPNIAAALDFSRWYQLSLLFLAPCFVLGGQALVENVASVLRRVARRSPFRNINRLAIVFVSVVLVGYFLSQSGFVNLITQATPYSNSLDFSRVATSKNLGFKVALYSAYIPEQNFFSTRWLIQHSGPQLTVYADYDSSQTVLLSYGVLSTRHFLLRNTTVPDWNSFVYLSKLNVRDAVITTRELTISWFNTSEISPIFEQSSLVYSNGDGEIWKVTSSG